MAKFKLYKLHFTSPLHLGDVRDDYSVSLRTIASDTMYAALTSCLAKLGQTIPNDGDLKCTISSLFPFYQKNKDSEAVLFFPKPLKQTLPEIDIDQRKKVKKVSWIDSDYFTKVTSGQTLFTKESKDEKNIHGEYLTTKIIDEHFISSQVSPRVSVSRDGLEDATPFYMDRVMFKDYSGLFFLATGDCQLLNKAIDLLQSEGIGTDRNIGNGYFEYESDDYEIKTPQNTEYAISLSSFVPESKEQLTMMLDSKDVAYDFQRRGGWITSPPYNTIRKNVIYMFTSASVFKKSIQDVELLGRIVNLQPKSGPKVDHPIWRCGRAIFLPIKTDQYGRDKS